MMITRKVTNKTGRPLALTPELKTEICERVALGETVRRISADNRMPAESTIYLTLSRDQAFAGEYARARELQCFSWEDEILEIADDSTGDWTARKGSDGKLIQVADHEHIQRSKVRIDTCKWLMAKRLPKRYGDKLTQEHVGRDRGPIKTRELSPLETARRIAFILNQADRELQKRNQEKPE